MITNVEVNMDYFIKVINNSDQGPVGPQGFGDPRGQGLGESIISIIIIISSISSSSSSSSSSISTIIITMLLSSVVVVVVVLLSLVLLLLLLLGAWRGAHDLAA